MVYVTRFMQGLRTRLAPLTNAHGQGLVEYALILVLASIFALVAVGFFGGRLTSSFSHIANSIT